MVVSFFPQIFECLDRPFIWYHSIFDEGINFYKLSSEHNLCVSFWWLFPVSALILLCLHSGSWCSICWCSCIFQIIFALTSRLCMVRTHTRYDITSLYLWKLVCWTGECFVLWTAPCTVGWNVPSAIFRRHLLGLFVLQCKLPQLMLCWFFIWLIHP